MKTNPRDSAQDRRAEGDEGFSLPELIVAIALTAVVMTMIVTLFTSFTRSFTEERALTDSINVAGIGMNETTRVIRAGTIIDRKDTADLPVFVKAEGESIILHSYLAEDSVDPRPLLIELSIDSNRQLVEKRWTSTKNSDDEWVFPATSTTPSSSKVVARKILAPTVAELAAGELNLFTYLNEDGNVMSSPSTNLGAIAAVKVTMIVQADETGRAKPVKLQNRVGIPNLSASRLGVEG